VPAQSDTTLSHWGRYLLEHSTHCHGLVLLLSTLSVFRVPVGWLAAVVVVFVTLRQGSRQGLMVLMWSFLPCAALLILQQWELALFSGLLLVCSYLLAVLLRATRSWVLVIESSVVIAMTGVAMFYALVRDPLQWWGARLLPYLKEMLSVQTIPVHQLKAITSFVVYWVSQFASGMEALFVSLTVIMVLLFASWWQGSVSEKFKKDQFWREVTTLRFGRLAWIVLLVCAGLAALGMHWALNGLVIVLLPFVIEGWSLVHAILHYRYRKHTTLMVVFYGGLLIFFPYMLFLLGCLGCVDSMVNFRYRYKITPRALP